MSRAAGLIACVLCLACSEARGSDDSREGGRRAASPRFLEHQGGAGNQTTNEAGATEAGASSATAGSGGTAGSNPTIITGLEPTEPYPPTRFPAENPYSAEKALLGKILFWDEQLSSHDTHACGTCHRPAAGGSDPRSAQLGALGAGRNGVFGDLDDARGSPGVARCDPSGAPHADAVYGLNPQLTSRKAPSALDAALFDELFWDGRATSSFSDPITGELAILTGGALESQAAGPPISDVEMSCEDYGWSAIESKLAAAVPLKLATSIPSAMAEALAQHPDYPALFAWAYGTPEVSARRILFAIATYERDLRSDQTPWDRYNAGDASALTPDQEAGLSVFNTKARCAVCHAPPAFTDGKFHNIGARAPELDPGRELTTSAPADRGKMKTPSLRNVGLRAPGGLLHFATGSGATLRSVLDVYRQGGVHTENLDPDIHVLNLPDFELDQLLDFLQHGLTDPRAAAEQPPFDRPRLKSEEEGR